MDQKVEWMADAFEVIVKAKRALHLGLIDVMEESKSSVQVVEVDKDTVSFRQAL